jgi:thioredoxin reductase
MDYDVIIIGGGAAGLSGAITLARSRRSVLVIDDGTPRNAPASGVHGFLGHDGIAPGELLARGRAELASYGGDFRDAAVSSVRRIAGGFDVDGTTARRLLVATGLVDELPDLPGLRARWGRDVVHCPYCHGWEVRDKAIAVLAVGPTATHQALLFSQLSKDVVLLANGVELTAEDQRALAARGVTVVAGAVASIVVVDDAIDAVRLADGTTVPCEVVAVGAPMRARISVLEQLGVETADFVVNGRSMGTHVPADPVGRTNIPGVWVAGNVSVPTGQVVHAAGAGVHAGALINYDLIEADLAAE